MREDGPARLDADAAGAAAVVRLRFFWKKASGIVCEASSGCVVQVQLMKEEGGGGGGGRRRGPRECVCSQHFFAALPEPNFDFFAHHFFPFGTKEFRISEHNFTKPDFQTIYHYLI